MSDAHNNTSSSIGIANSTSSPTTPHSQPMSSDPTVALGHLGLSQTVMGTAQSPSIPCDYNETGSMKAIEGSIDSEGGDGMSGNSDTYASTSRTNRGYLADSENSAYRTSRKGSEKGNRGASVEAEGAADDADDEGQGRGNSEVSDEEAGGSDHEDAGSEKDVEGVDEGDIDEQGTCGDGAATGEGQSGKPTDEGYAGDDEVSATDYEGDTEIESEVQDEHLAGVDEGDEADDELEDGGRT